MGLKITGRVGLSSVSMGLWLPPASKKKGKTTAEQTSKAATCCYRVFQAVFSTCPNVLVLWHLSKCSPVVLLVNCSSTSPFAFFEDGGG